MHLCCLGFGLQEMDGSYYMNILSDCPKSDKINHLLKKETILRFSDFLYTLVYEKHNVHCTVGIRVVQIYSCPLKLIN